MRARPRIETETGLRSRCAPAEYRRCIIKAPLLIEHPRDQAGIGDGTVRFFKRVLFAIVEPGRLVMLMPGRSRLICLRSAGHDTRVSFLIRRVLHRAFAFIVVAADRTECRTDGDKLDARHSART